jgi:PTS system nitrogen regulatory IIA component
MEHMNIRHILSENAVLFELQTATQVGVLAELVTPLLVLHPELRHVDVVSILSRRESLGSTAMGDGIAIPHGKIPGLSTLCLSVGRSSKGIDFFAPDGQRCHIFFLILMSEQGAGQHLRLLAQIARRAKNPVFRREVRLAENVNQLHQVIIAP